MINIIWVKLKDYKNSMPMIIVMTVMALALIYIFGQGFEGGYRPSVAIADNDRTQTSKSYIAQIIKDEAFDFSMVIPEEGKRRLEKGEFVALVEVSQGFEEGLAGGESNVIMYKSGDSIEHHTLKANLENTSRLFMTNEGFVQGFSAALAPMGIEVNGEELHETIASNREQYPVMALEVVSFDVQSAGGFDAIKHSFMGYILFFSMFTMVFGVGSIVEDRENRVWHRQVVSPVSNMTYLAGSMVASFIVGMLQLSFMVIFARFVFGIDFGGSIIAMLIVLAGYVIAITCLGLLLSNLVKTSQQLGSFSPVIIVGTSMIGGCMWPLSIINSKFLLFLADLTPQRWAYLGLKRILVGNGGIADVMMPMVYLLIIAAVLFVLAMIPQKRIAS